MHARRGFATSDGYYARSLDPMKRLLKNLLVRASGNALMQRMLERNVEWSQRLMGVGAGDSVDSSGEAVLVTTLREYFAQTSRALCVFDVGANAGQFLGMILRGLQDIPFTAHAFEPARETYRALVASRGGVPSIVLNNLGLGHEAGELLLYYDQERSGSASLSKRTLAHFGVAFDRSERVPIKTLDAYCNEAGVTHIDLLKLDVEGHELDVLRGATDMLTARRINMISFEFGGCNIDSRTFFQDFWYFLHEHGMGRIFRIAPAGYLVALPAYREAYEQFRTTNFVAFQDGTGAPERNPGQNGASSTPDRGG